MLTPQSLAYALSPSLSVSPIPPPPFPPLFLKGLAGLPHTPPSKDNFLQMFSTEDKQSKHCVLKLLEIMLFSLGSCRQLDT